MTTIIFAKAGKAVPKECFETTSSIAGLRSVYYNANTFSDKEVLVSGAFKPGMKLDSITYCTQEPHDKLSYIQMRLFMPPDRDMDEFTF